MPKMPITPVSRRASSNDASVRREVRTDLRASNLIRVAKSSKPVTVEGAKAKAAMRPPNTNITRVRASFQQESVDLSKLRHHSDPEGPSWPALEAQSMMQDLLQDMTKIKKHLAVPAVGTVDHGPLME